jgi:hypothetical protein
VQIPMHRGRHSDLIARHPLVKREDIQESELSRGLVSTRVQFFPIAIGGGDEDADRETVHASDTTDSAAAF